MQVKVCPKCGAENKPDKASCSGCYSSLEGVVETEAKARPAPEPTQPQAQAPPPAQPLGQSPLSGPATPTGPTPADNYAPPPGAPSPYGAPMTFPERRSAPASRGPNWGAIALVIVLLAGAGFGGWWAYNKFFKPSPEAVVQKMIDATKAGDYDMLKSCLSQSSVSMMSMSVGEDEQAAREQMKKSAGKDPATKITGTTYEDDGKTAVVSMESTKPLPAGMPASMKTTEMVLLREEGQWKVDLVATSARMMKKIFGGKGMRMPKPSP